MPDDDDLPYVRVFDENWYAPLEIPKLGPVPPASIFLAPILIGAAVVLFILIIALVMFAAMGSASKHIVEQERSERTQGK